MAFNKDKAKQDESIQPENVAETEAKEGCQAEQTDGDYSVEEALAKMAKAYAGVEAEKSDLENKLLRIQADFDNFRKRTRNEKEEWKNQIIADFCGDILPIMDNFARALKAMSDDEASSSHLPGVEMIARQMAEMMLNKGVEKIATVGEDFDPKYHEAVARAEVTDAAQDNKVLVEIQSGYKIGDRLIRPAMVQVGVKA